MSLGIPGKKEGNAASYLEFKRNGLQSYFLEDLIRLPFSLERNGSESCQKSLESEGLAKAFPELEEATMLEHFL